MSTITERCRCGDTYTYDADEETRSYCDACAAEEREAEKLAARRDAHEADAFDRAGDR